MTYDDYYREQLQEAQEFQDFVARELWHRLGVALVNYQSQKYQQRFGENECGWEIKYDKKRATTGNLYFETAEKSHPDNSEYVTSGIYRNDNTWMYCIGDYVLLYVFPKKWLVRAHKSGKFPEPEPTGTSKGFLISEKQAREAAAIVVRFNAATLKVVPAA